MVIAHLLSLPRFGAALGARNAAALGARNAAALGARNAAAHGAHNECHTQSQAPRMCGVAKA